MFHQLCYNRHMRYYKIGDFYRNKHTDGVIQIVGDSGPIGDTNGDEPFIYNGLYQDDRWWITVGPPTSADLGQMMVEANPQSYLDNHCAPTNRPDWWPL